jgi:hypothetical protein
MEMKIYIKEIKIIILLVISWIGVQSQNIDTITAYPNPFYDTLNIGFELSASDTGSLKVFQLNGATTTVLFEDSLLASGVHHLTVNLDTLIPESYVVVLNTKMGGGLGVRLIKSEFPLSNDQLPNQNLSAFYPNPSTGILFSINQSLERITIYDLKGRRVKDLLNVGQAIDCSDLPHGTYIFKMRLTTGVERFQIIEMVN